MYRKLQLLLITLFVFGIILTGRAEVPQVPWPDLIPDAKAEAMTLQTAGLGADRAAIKSAVQELNAAVASEDYRKLIAAYWAFFEKGHLQSENAAASLAESTNDSSVQTEARLLHSELLIGRGQSRRAREALSKLIDDESVSKRAPLTDLRISILEASIARFDGRYGDAKKLLQKVRELLPRLTGTTAIVQGIRVDRLEVALLMANEQKTRAELLISQMVMDTPWAERRADSARLSVIDFDDSERKRQIELHESLLASAEKLVGEGHGWWCEERNDELLAYSTRIPGAEYFEACESFFPQFEAAFKGELDSISSYWVHRFRQAAIGRLAGVEKAMKIDQLDLLKRGTAAAKQQFGPGASRHVMMLKFYISQLILAGESNLVEADGLITELDMLTRDEPESLARANYLEIRSSFIGLNGGLQTDSHQNLQRALEIRAKPENYGPDSPALLDTLRLLLKIAIDNNDKNGITETRERIDRIRNKKKETHTLTDEELVIVGREINDLFRRAQRDEALRQLATVAKMLLTESENLVDGSLDEDFHALRILLFTQEVGQGLRHKLVKNPLWLALHRRAADFGHITPDAKLLDIDPQSGDYPAPQSGTPFAHIDKLNDDLDELILRTKTPYTPSQASRLLAKYTELIEIRRGMGFDPSVRRADQSIANTLFDDNPKMSLRLLLLNDARMREWVEGGLLLRSEAAIEAAVDELESFKSDAVDMLMFIERQQQKQLSIGPPDSNEADKLASLRREVHRRLTRHKALMRSSLVAYYKPPSVDVGNINDKFIRLREVRTRIKEIQFKALSPSSMQPTQARDDSFATPELAHGSAEVEENDPIDARVELFQLSTELRRLERQLAPVSAEPVATSLLAIDSIDILADLPQHTLLIDFVEYQPRARLLELFDIPTESLGSTERLAAFIAIRSVRDENTSIQHHLIDLGPSEAIRKLVGDWHATNRHTFGPKHILRKKLPVSIRQKILKPLLARRVEIEKQLFDLVWRPLVQAVKTKNGEVPFASVVISPDGPVSTLSHACLRDADGIPIAASGLPIQYVNSSRKLSSIETKTPSVSDNKVMSVVNVAVDSYRVFDPLVGSEEEARHIADLASASSLNAELFLGGNATIPNIMKVVHADQRLRWVSFSCHGYTGTWPTADIADIFSIQEEAQVQGTDVAALFLADDAEVRSAVLIREDIVGLPLQNVDVVILEACHAGLGKLVRSQGIHGLRDAFLAAGTGSVIAPIDPIGNRDTIALMRHVYTRLASGVTPPLALAEAMKRRYKAIADEGHLDDSTHWGLFVSESTTTPN